MKNEIVKYEIMHTPLDIEHATIFECFMSTEAIIIILKLHILQEGQYNGHFTLILLSCKYTVCITSCL